MIALVFLLLWTQQSTPLPGDEGDLANRSFLPKISPIAQAALVEFRSQLQRERSLEAGLALSRLLENCDLEGEMIFPTERLGLGLRESMESSLASLPTRERESYAKLAEEGAKDALLGRTRDEAALRRVARAFPGSPLASRALQTLGDLAFERGDFLAAESLFRRCRLDSSQRWSQRIASVAKPALSALAPAKSWSAPLPEEKALFANAIVPCIAENSLFTQTGRFLYEHDAQGKELLRFSLDDAIFDRDFVLRSPENDEEDNTPEAPLHPQWLGRGFSPWDGDAVFLMHSAGSVPPFARRLAGMRVASGSTGRIATLMWQRGWGLENGTDLDDLVLSEGFLVREGRIFLQAHRVRADASCFALCLDARTGTLLWKRFLGKGAAAADDPKERLRTTTPRPPSPLPPLLFPGTILFATNLGVLAALDPEDGALLWALRTDRSKDGEFRWKRGAFVADHGDALLAPEDSGWLLRVAPHLPPEEPLPAAHALFRAPAFRGTPGQRFLGTAQNREIFLETTGQQTLLAGIDRSSSASVRSVDGFGSGVLLDQKIQGPLVLLVFDDRIACLDAAQDLRLVAEIFPEPLPSKGEKDAFRGASLLPSGIVGVVSKRLMFWPHGKTSENSK